MVRPAAVTNRSSGTVWSEAACVAPDRGFGGWGCPGPLALTGVGDQLSGAPARTQSTRKARVFDKNQTFSDALSQGHCRRIRHGHYRLAFDYLAAFTNYQIAALYLDK